MKNWRFWNQNNELKGATKLIRVEGTCARHEEALTWCVCCLSVQYVLHGSDLRSLHRHIPRSVLPEEYGGTAGQLDMRAWSRLLLDCEEEFIVEFCQPDPLEGVVLPDSMLFEGQQAGGQDDDTFRGLRSQLYYCYWGQWSCIQPRRWDALFHREHGTFRAGCHCYMIYFTT